MNIRLIISSLLSLTVISFSITARAQQIPAPAVQAPTLALPQPGSLIGTEAQLAYGIGSGSRGDVTVPIAMALPSEGGAPGVNPLPTYSSEAGLSEWGMGWASALAITRFRATGELDFSTDDFTSPWGHLVRGDDGYFYPAGLRALVRVEAVGNAMIAYTPDGGRWTFDKRVSSPRGTYGWMLSRIDSPTGRETILEYTINASGRYFLSRLSWGGVGDDLQYQVRLEYETVPTALVEYRSGKALALDRRVSAVRVLAKNNGSGAFELRYRYTLRYEQAAASPMFYLVGVTKRAFAGGVEPEVKYSYDKFGDAPQDLRAVTTLNSQTWNPDTSVFNTWYMSFFDFQEDGLLEFEYNDAPGQYHYFTSGGAGGSYGVGPESLPPSAPADRLPACWPNLSIPRHIVKMIPGSLDPNADTNNVVAFTPATSGTDFNVCDRAGKLLWHQNLAGDWSHTPTVVDLNHDFYPDVVRFLDGAYEVAMNTSTAPANFSLAAPRRVDVPGLQAALPHWIYDFNGDGIADVVEQSSGVNYLLAVKVWYGLGGFQYSAPQLIDLPVAIESPVDLPAFKLDFIDANKDGATDFVVSGPSIAYVLLNDVNGGAVFWRSYTVDRAPLLVDLVGEGSTEMLAFRGARPFSVALSTPSTHLLKSVDNGRGHVTRLSYAAGPEFPELRRRPAVVASDTVESLGQAPVTRTYQYWPKVFPVHSAGFFFIGYDEVDVTAGDVVRKRHFINQDDVNSLLKMEDLIGASEEASVFMEYENAVFHGVPWLRVILKRRDKLLVQADETFQYGNDVPCADTVSGAIAKTYTTWATVKALPKNILCWPAQQSFSDSISGGSGPTIIYTRNDAGLITAISQMGEGFLILEQITYNPDYTIAKITRPGRGTTRFTYAPHSLLLDQITAPDGSWMRVDQRSLQLGEVTQSSVGRGDKTFSIFYDYDDLGRLVRQWNTLAPESSRANPLEKWGYSFGTAANPAELVHSVTVDGQSASTTIDYLAATGALITSAQQTTEGYAYAPVVWRDPLNRSTRVSQHVATRRYAESISDLLRDLQEVSFIKRDPLGFVSEARQKFHADVERRVSDAITPINNSAALQRTTTENGALTTTTTYDGFDRPIAQVDEAGGKYTFSYDGLSRLYQVTLPDNTTHHLQYDAYGRVLRVTRDNVAQISYNYDPTSGLLTKKHFYSAANVEQRNVTFQYDGIGRLASETYTDVTSGQSQVYRYFYDGATPAAPTATGSDVGMLTGVSGDGYSKTFAYRADRKVLRQTTIIDGFRQVVDDFSYYDDGRPKAQTTTLLDAAGTTLWQTTTASSVDAVGRVKSIALNGAPLVDLDFNADSQLARERYAGGGSRTWIYDPLTRGALGYSYSDGTTAASTALRYNARGLIDNEVFQIGAKSITRNYAYSAQGFLASATPNGVAPGDDHTYGYGFSLFGLPTSITKDGATKTLTQTGNVLDVGGTKYTFDALGRVAQIGDLSLTYGPNGHIASARRGSAEWTYLYDESGQRLVKRTGGQITAAYVGGRYLEGANLHVPLRIGGALAGVISNNVFRFMPVDTRETRITGAGGAARLSSPFGESDAHPELAAMLDYVGKGYDADLGLVRMGVRDYDPESNRFLQPDPLYLERPGLAIEGNTETNLYSYARSNPVNFSDPSGMRTDDCDGPDDCAGSGSGGGGYSHGIDNPGSGGSVAWYPETGTMGQGDTIVVTNVPSPPPPPPPTDPSTAASDAAGTQGSRNGGNVGGDGGQGGGGSGGNSGGGGPPPLKVFSANADGKESLLGATLLGGALVAQPELVVATAIVVIGVQIYYNKPPVNKEKAIRSLEDQM